MHVATYPSVPQVDDQKIITKKRSFKSHRLLVSGVALIVSLMLFVSLGIALFSLTKNTENRQQAAANPAVIVRFNPETLSVVINQEFTVPIELDTGTKAIAVAEVLPDFDPTYFQAISLTSSTFLPTTLVSSSVTTAGTFSPLLIAKPFSVPPTSAVGTGQIALMKVKALKAGTATISFNQTRTRAPEFMGEPSNLIGTFRPLVVTIGGGQLPPNVGTHQCVSLAPANANGVVNTAMSFTCTVNAETASTVNFRVLSGTVPIPSSLKSSNVSPGQALTPTFEYTPTTIGTQVAQCQICAQGSTTKCSPWGFATPIYDTPACVWCTDSCKPTGSCTPTSGQTEGNSCDAVSLACANRTWTQACQQSFVVTTTPAGLVCAGTQVDPTTAIVGTTQDFTIGCTRNPAAEKYKIRIIDNISSAPIKTVGIAQTAVGTNPSYTFKVDQIPEGTYRVSCVPCSTADMIDSSCAPVTNDCRASFTLTEADGTPALTSLQLEFTQQGLRKAGVEIPATVTVAYTASGSSKIVREYAKTFVSSTSGILKSQTPLKLRGIATDTPIPNAAIYVKTRTSLRKRLGTVTLREGTVPLLTTTELFIGDFNQEGIQKNLFNILDVSKMLAQYKALDNPITDTNRDFDVNYDDNFNILDASLVISNYQTLELEGQTP